MKHIYYRFSFPDKHYDELVEASTYGIESLTEAFNRLVGDEEEEDNENPSIRH